jgi:hypothetical protein
MAKGILTPQAKPAITTATATILAGQWLSTSVDLTAGNMVMLITPDDWTAANIGFQFSEDNINFRDLYDDSGHMILKPIGPQRAINVDPTFTAGALYVKFVSGSRLNPVLQAADRVFTIIIQ